MSRAVYSAYRERIAVRMIRSWHICVSLIVIIAISACGAPPPLPATATLVPVTVTPVPATVAPATPLPDPTATGALPSDTSTGHELNPIPLVAVQTIIDYYTAINQQQYATAYHLWAQPSQTLAQFSAGFANTVESRVRIGLIELMFDTVTVPVTITAVINQTNGEQQVQWFAGTYTVQHNTIIAADITPMAAPSTHDDDEPAQLLTHYYTALQNMQFGTAYTLWADNGTASQLAYADFVHSIADSQATITTGTVQQEGAAGSSYATVPVVVVGVAQDGSPQVRCGTYTTRRAMVPPFDQLGWRITQADMAVVAGAQPDATHIQHLLTQGCMP